MKIKTENLYTFDHKLKSIGSIKGKILISDYIKFPYKIPGGEKKFEKKGIIIDIEDNNRMIHEIKKYYPSVACLKRFDRKLIGEFMFLNAGVPKLNQGSFSGVMELDHTSFEYKKCMITVNTILEKIIEKETWDITSHLNSIKL